LIVKSITYLQTMKYI